MTLLKHLRRFNSIDLLLFYYIIVTSCFIIFFNEKIPSTGLHLLFRFIFLIFMMCLPYLDVLTKRPVFYFLRTAYPLIFFGFFYSETDALNNVFFQDLDYSFAKWDSILFGYQPSLEFFNHFSNKWVSELMNFGYFSYYFLIAGYVILVFRKNKEDFKKTIFYITCSFLLYYIIFIIIPVSGPQYFFDPPHNTIPNSGIFRTLVRWVELLGERPTAAFPSSHVGIILIVLILSSAKNLKIWYWLVPLFLLLTLSTVYIKAHYAVDVIGGIFSAPLILFLSKKIYTYLEKRDFNK